MFFGGLGVKECIVRYVSPPIHWPESHTPTAEETGQCAFLTRSLFTTTANEHQQAMLMAKAVRIIRPVMLPVGVKRRASKTHQHTVLPGKSNIIIKASPSGFPCGLPVAAPNDPRNCVRAKTVQNAFQFIQACPVAIVTSICESTVKFAELGDCTLRIIASL